MLFSAEGLMGGGGVVNSNVLQTFSLCPASPNMLFLTMVVAITKGMEDSQHPEGPEQSG